MSGMVQEQNLEKQLEKQMGCMAGFLQIFDRHQILTGKRLYSTKRLPPSMVMDSVSESEKTMASPAMSSSTEFDKPQQLQLTRPMPSPDRLKQSPVPELLSPVEVQQPKSPLLLPVFEIKEGTKSSWKFCKEAPRLSLDSRATFDAKGSLKPKEIRANAATLSANGCHSNVEDNDDSERQRRSPSVIARLMGLEKLPDSGPEQGNKLRRSASESRASRDLFQYRFIDDVNFQLKQAPQQNTQSNISGILNRDSVVKDQAINGSGGDNVVRSMRAEQARAPNRGFGQRKSFFDSADFFPEPKQTGPVSVCGKTEKRLKMRAIDETSKDLETLKQILEALQLKGLLRSKRSLPVSQINHRHLVYDGSYSYDESPIVVMKPARSPGNRSRRIVNDSTSPSSFRARTGARRNQCLSSDTLSAMSPRRNQPETEPNVRNQTRWRSGSSQTRSDDGIKSPIRRIPLNVEKHRKVSNDSVDSRRVSPVQSPKVNPRRMAQNQTVNRSPRNRKQTIEIYQKEEKVFDPAEDESSSISESSISTDVERSNVEDYNEGRNLLERCDKLLHSIAEMTATAELQPSPVSVLDSSFYKEESSLSPVMKRSMDFKDQLAELEDDIWSLAMSTSDQSRSEENADDCDFVYVSDIIRASNCLAVNSDVFLLLEKQQCLKGKNLSKVSRLERKLIFDTITEILNRKRQLPPWKVITWTSSADGQTSLQQIWSEFQRIREREMSDDLFEIICGVLKKDLAGDSINGWEDCPIEMSEAVLDIERLIFKDLISETIRNLALSAPKCNQLPLPRRKLVF